VSSLSYLCINNETEVQFLNGNIFFYKVVFCNPECYAAASVLHDLECKILKLIDSSEKLGKMAVLCFRTIARTPLAIIKVEHEKWSVQSPSAETILGVDDDGVLDSSTYSSVYAQTSNSSDRHAGDMLKRCYAALYLTLCLRHVGYFFRQSVSSGEKQSGISDDEMVVSVSLLRHLQSVSCNAYGINMICKAEVMKTLEIDEVGGATYPIISTTNHSCYPNVYRFNIGKVCVVNSLREISEGEEILDSYGPQFTTAPVEQRIQELENQYLFRCTCLACLENWPGFKEMKCVRQVWKCQSCGVGTLEDNSAGNKRKCLNCKQITDIRKSQKALKSAEERYLKAKNAVLHQQDALDIEKHICNFITLVQRMLMCPNKEIIEAQELLKLHWNLGVKDGIISV
jgi:hypothetical protein